MKNLLMVIYFARLWSHILRNLYKSLLISQNYRFIVLIAFYVKNNCQDSILAIVFISNQLGLQIFLGLHEIESKGALGRDAETRDAFLQFLLRLRT